MALEVVKRTPSSNVGKSPIETIPMRGNRLLSRAESEIKRDSLFETSAKLNYAMIDSKVIKNEHKETESEKVLGYFSQKKVEKFVSKASLIVTLKGIAKTVVSISRLVIKKVKEIPRSFSKFEGSYGFGFDAISVGVAAYSLYDDSKKAVKAFKNADREELIDRSVQLVSSSASIPSDVLGAVAFSETLKGTPSAIAKATSLGLGASWLGFSIWGIYMAVQAVAIKRITSALSSLKKIFKTSKTIEDKYTDAIAKLNKSVGIREDSDEFTKNVENKLSRWIRKKQPSELQIKGKRESLIKALIAKKRNHLRKRAGGAVANEILESVGLLNEILQRGKEDSKFKESDEYKKAMRESQVLVQKYRAGLKKQLKLSAIKLLGAVVGFTSSIVALSNPITAGIISGIAAGILIYSIYRDKKNGVESFKKDTFLGIKSYDFDMGEDLLKPKINEEKEELISAITSSVLLPVKEKHLDERRASFSSSSVSSADTEQSDLDSEIGDKDTFLEALGSEVSLQPLGKSKKPLFVEEDKQMPLSFSVKEEERDGKSYLSFLMDSENEDELEVI